MCCVFLVTVLAAGFGPDHKPPKGAPPIKTEPIEGTVKLGDGTPLNDGFVEFTPSTGSSGVPGAGTVASGGHFKVGIGQGDQGLPAGDYKVSFSPTLTGIPPKDSNAHLIPKIYHEESTTPLTAKVVSGSNKFEFELK